jgi:hypothetical protein
MPAADQSFEETKFDACIISALFSRRDDYL